MSRNDTNVLPDDMKREAVERLLAWRFPIDEIAAKLDLSVQEVEELERERGHQGHADDTAWITSSHTT
jgi:hypothetical protein